MAIKIGHACKDEHNKYKNGVAGDQTKQEVYIRTWYNRPWNYIIRCKNELMREKIAKCMEMACNNDLIGYDQNQRNTLLTHARKVGYDPSKVNTPCETDCSALVSLCCIYAGIPESALFIGNNSSTTSVLRSRLVKTGLFEVYTTSTYTKSDKYLKRGDILLYEGHHVAVALENGSGNVTTSSTPSNNNVYTQQKFILDVCNILGVKTALEAFNKTVTISTKNNKNHALVTPLERYMKSLGYYTGSIESDLKKTPCFGTGMENATKTFQKNIVKATVKNQDGVWSAKGASWKKALGL